MAPRDPLFGAWMDAARATPIADVASVRGLRLRGSVEKVGPCPGPGCGGTDRFGLNTRKNVFGCRRCGASGGPIDLVMLCDGVDAVKAAEILTGRPPPGAGSGVTAEDLARIEQERTRRQVEAAVSSMRYSEEERTKLWRWWSAARAPAGTPVETYLRLRGLSLPPTKALRFHPKFGLYHDRKGGSVRVHEGPAMFAAIRGPDGHFSGLHMTWLDLTKPDGKAEVANPDTGEIGPAKKVRGSKTAGRIELVRVEAPVKLVIGEGIETTLSARQALIEQGVDVARIAFWASIDLHNLGGKHVGTVAHPTERVLDVRGRSRPVRLASAVPDLDAPAIAVPDGVEEVITLGDGDSDPVLTRLTHERAKARWARPGLTVRAVFPPANVDFNTFLRGARP